VERKVEAWKRTESCRKEGRSWEKRWEKEWEKKVKHETKEGREIWRNGGNIGRKGRGV
jgi:hypothetical protein